MKISLDSEFGRAIKFMLGGGAGVGANYAALYALTEWVNVWYPISAFIGGTMNTVLNFTIQKFWTYKNRETKFIRRQATEYAVMTGAFTITNPLLLYLLVQYAGMWYISAQVIITCVFTVISWFRTRSIFTR